jgi:hypothetical protein
MSDAEARAIFDAMSRLRRESTRECARCRRVLVDEDDQGWYYQAPVADPEVRGLTFMDRVHECEGKPHEVVPRGTLAVAPVTGEENDGG